MVVGLLDRTESLGRDGWVARRSDQVGYESTRRVPETREVRYIYRPITLDITSPSKVRPKA